MTGESDRPETDRRSSKVADPTVSGSTAARPAAGDCVPGRAGGPQSRRAPFDASDARQRLSRTRRRLFSPLLAGALLVTLGACAGDNGERASDGASGGSGRGNGAVIIDDFAFMPSDVEVAAGTTVRWENEDSAQHTVKDKSALGFGESERLSTGDVFEHTYEEAGEFEYQCGIHPSMEGTVLVRR